MPGAANQGRFQFTGQIWLAEVGLYHYKARLYDPWLGRFLQTDPIGYEDQQISYAYAGNDPVNAIDPTGEDALYLTGEVVFVAGFLGGRLDISAGYDTAKGTLFIGYAGGGAIDPFTPTPAVAGLQIGAGGGVGWAESSEFIFSPASTHDADLILGSVSAASNDPWIGYTGYNMPWTDGSTALESDARPRQVELQGGVGGGASQVATSGRYIEVGSGDVMRGAMEFARRAIQIRERVAPRRDAPESEE